ncbi:MAG: 50S ribosomal protein L15 [Deltaproteobacteria bacterium]|nr:50S ribosomal protein L15 [Deltaproteobacteria bacterium]
MKLNELTPPKGAVKDRKRIGRGNASGQGGTAGKGHKGHKARAGKNQGDYFEGGQMSISRRIPKRGFTNGRFRKVFATVNVGDLARFTAGQVVDPALLVESHVVRKAQDGIKVLSDGDLTVALTVKAHGFSAKAKEKILAAGGQVELIKS